jgi:uncharacterized protein (TIGR01777 family)
VNKKNILITGATGLIGTALSQKLREKGYKPFILTTSLVNNRNDAYHWDPTLKICDLLPDENFYAAINLAGASISDTKWNEAGKELILKSRTNSTEYLASLVQSMPHKPEHIISASAIGYYGVKNDSIKTEESPSGNDFAALVCRDWENAAKTMETPNSKLSILRIGIVLGKNGGFYKKIKDLAKWKIAAPIGSGKQVVCWIHLEDLVNIFVAILEDQIKPGIYNAVVATNTNKEVTKIIAKKNGQGLLPPAIPSFLVKLLFGQKAEIFTESAEVSSSKLIREGFKFQFTDLNKAITDLAK